jgi:dihydrodipicolinate reductase
MNNGKIKVMVNGLAVQMAKNFARLAQKDYRLELLVYSLAATKKHYDRVGGTTITLIQSGEWEDNIGDFKHAYGQFITVDFADPSEAADNVSFYVQHGLPFVLGTPDGSSTNFDGQVFDTTSRHEVFAVQLKRVEGIDPGHSTYLNSAIHAVCSLYERLTG